MSEKRIQRLGWLQQVGYLAGYYVRSRLRQQAPLLGGVKLGHRCNLSCAHCPFWRRETPSLSYPQALSSLRSLHESGVRFVILEGGEPFLWRDGDRRLEDVVVAARDFFFSVSITTNGTWPINTTADTVWVSIDGLPETHDHIRGRTFERIMANIEASSHPRILAHVTINALNWREIPELVPYLAERVRGITVQFHYPYDELDEALFLPIEQRRQVLETLIDLKRRGWPLLNSYACLRALQRQRWRCHPWMIASVDPDGTVTHGCYVQGRGPIACERCGFSAHTEISLAYEGRPSAMLAGHRLLLGRARPVSGG